MRIFVYFVLLFFFSQTAIAGENISNKRFLVTAVPKDIIFIRNDESHLVSPGYYKLKIKNIEIMQGDMHNFPKEIFVNIRANNGDAILGYDRIFLVLDVDAKNKINVVYWERVVSIACVPKDIIDERYAPRYFENKWGNPKVLCTFLRGYNPPPSP